LSFVTGLFHLLQCHQGVSMLCLARHTIFHLWINHTLLVHSFIDGHFGCFHLLTIYCEYFCCGYGCVNSYLDPAFTSFEMHAVVELLDHTGSLFSFQGAATLLFLWLHHCIFHSSFSSSFSTLAIFWFGFTSDSSYLNGCEAICHCGFDLFFFND
jgi:hypothetical protein